MTEWIEKSARMVGENLPNGINKKRSHPGKDSFFDLHITDEKKRLLFD